MASLSLSALYSYSRTPEVEEKVFYFPSVILAPPDLSPEKIEQKLTPLKSFLESQKREFAYITKTNDVMFNLPFVSSFYYYVPLSLVDSLNLNNSLTKEETLNLKAEDVSDDSPLEISYDLNHLKVSPYFTNPRSQFYLEKIIFDYQNNVTSYISPKARTYTPSSINVFLPQINQINAPKFYVLQTTVYARLENVDENQLTIASTFEPSLVSERVPAQGSYIFKIDPKTSLNVTSSTLVFLKKQTTFHTILTFPSIKKSISLFQPNPIEKISRTPILNELPTFTYEPNSLYLKPVNNWNQWKTGSNKVSCKVTNDLSPPLTSFHLKSRKSSLSKSLSLDLPFIPLSVKISHRKFEKNLSPRKESDEFAMHSQALPFESKLELDKTTATNYRFDITPSPLKFKNHPPVILKKAIPYSLSVEIPNLSPQFSKLISPEVMAQALPSKNSTELPNIEYDGFFLAKLQLSKNNTGVLQVSLTPLSFSLIPNESEENKKSHILATLNQWSPRQKKQIDNFFLLTEKPQTFFSSKEEVSNPLFESNHSLSLSLINGQIFSQNQFYVTEFIPALAGDEPIELSGAKLNFNSLNNSVLTSLISRKRPLSPSELNKTPSLYKTVHLARLEKIKVNESDYFNQTLCSISLPESASHKVHPSKSSKALEFLVSTPSGRSGRKFLPKEGVFPKKEFLQAGLITTSTEVLSYPPFSIPYSNAIADLAENSISYFETEIPPALVDLIPFDTKFMPPIEFKELMVALLEIKAVSEFSFIREEATSINRSNRFLVHNLSELPSLEFLQTYSLGDDFKVDVHVIKKMEKEGYAFSLQVSPYNHDCLDPLPEHIYFILDRSSSIESHRFASFKSSLIQALSQIDESATFNIITFDQTCEKLSAEDLKPTKSAIQFMRKNLDKVSQKWSSSFSALISQIEAIQKQAEELGEPHTVIILSNGHFLKNIRFNRESLYKIFHNQTDNFSLCTAAVSDNNNMAMLELLSKLGRGEFLHSQTHAAFPRKLAVLVKKIQKPIASDISITLTDPSQKINFAHNTKTAPLFYSGKPYTIYGQAEKLEDLSFIIQGKSGDKWLNIVKKINLSKAAKGKAIDKELFTKEALTHVLNFIFTNKQSELVLAKDLITPYDVKWSL